MTKETKKIMEDDSIAVSATCVRIPVLSAHSESVYIETKEIAPIDEASSNRLFQALFSKMMLPTKFILKQSMVLEVVIPLLVAFVRIWTRRMVSICGLFQITYSRRVLRGTQFKSQKHFMNVVLFVQQQS